MQWTKAPIAGLFVIGLSAVALLSASEMAKAAPKAKADALRQMNRTTTKAAVSSQIQQGLPADWQGSGIPAVTEDPILKLAHCCHAHPIPPTTAIAAIQQAMRCRSMWRRASTWLPATVLVP